MTKIVFIFLYKTHHKCIIISRSVNCCVHVICSTSFTIFLVSFTVNVDFLNYYVFIQDDKVLPETISANIYDFDLRKCLYALTVISTMQGNYWVNEIWIYSSRPNYYIYSSIVSRLKMVRILIEVFYRL